MAEDMEKAVTMIREAYAAYNRGDFDASAANLHPDVEYHRVADVETALTGPDAVRENMEPKVWEQQRIEVGATEVIGEHVVMDTVFHAVGAGSGIQLDQEGFHLWRVKDAKGIEFRFFLEREDAVAEARSREGLDPA